MTFYYHQSYCFIITIFNSFIIIINSITITIIKTILFTIITFIIIANVMINEMSVLASYWVVLRVCCCN